MIADKIKRMESYPELRDSAKLIKDFIGKVKEENLPDGKYELQGEDLFALVQRYETREKKTSRMESHRKYIDLQYMLSGEEMFYCAFAEDLTIAEDKFEQNDIGFFEPCNEEIGIHLKEDMFVYLLPSDAHMPCCQIEGAKAVEKIVFKIKLHK